jgi:hypothetical protein
METVFYTGAMITGFMISQTYNYFFGYSNPSNSANVPVHTSINIHTHQHPYSTPYTLHENKQEDNKDVHTPIPKSLLCDIALFQNKQLKPVDTTHISKRNYNGKTILFNTDGKITFEEELKQRMLVLRKKTMPVLDIN